MQSSIQVRWRVGSVALCVVALSVCTRAALEQRLRATLKKMHQAIEARGIGEAMALVAEDFVGEQRLDAAGLRRLTQLQMMQLQMLGNRRIGVTLGPGDVQLRDDTASVRFTALLTGGSGRWLPEQAQTYQVTTSWRLQGGDWRLYHAQWEPTGR